MGRSKARAGLLIVPALALPAADRLSDPPLREMRWLVSATKAEDMVRLPNECLSWPADPARRRSAEIGRVAFRAPLLLGGQAARSGLSCSSCHINGRGNPHFHFPGISGDPGTADVTASLLSSHRGDDKFNPKPIPDLARPEQQRIASRDSGKRDLERFIHGLIVEEFDGPEPPPRVLNGLADYVRSIGPATAQCEGYVGRTLAGTLDEIAEAIRLARQSAEDNDQATARTLLGAARSNLGRIDERLPGLKAERALLREADSDLKDIQAAPFEPLHWKRWDRDWRKRRAALLLAGPRSLYSEARLRRALASRD